MGSITKGLFAKGLLILFTLHTQLCLAQYAAGQTYTPPVFTKPQGSIVPVGSVATHEPRNVQVGNQYYDASFSGLRRYLDKVVQKDNKAMYDHLDTSLKQLETNSKWAKLAWVAGIGGGLILSGIGMSDQNQCDKDFPDTSSSQWRNCYHSFDSWVFGGLGLALGGLVFGLYIHPDREDFLNFINKHNELNKETPIKFQLGLVPNGQIKGILSYNF